MACFSPADLVTYTGNCLDRGAPAASLQDLFATVARHCGLGAGERVAMALSRYLRDRRSLTGRIAMAALIQEIQMGLQQRLALAKGALGPRVHPF